MKKLLLLMMAIMLVFALAACGTGSTTVPTTAPTGSLETTPSEEPELLMFSVAVEGVEEVTEFNQDYYNDMDIQTVTLSITKNDEVKNYVCTGVLMKDVMDMLGATDYTSVTVQAADYEKVYTKEMIDEATTFFAVEVNGETTDCPETFAASQGSGYSIKNVIKLIVE